MSREPATPWRVHYLKTWPQFYRDLLADRTHVEVRRNDRDYRVGDVLWLREWDPRSRAYTGRGVLRFVRAVKRLPPPIAEYVALEIVDAAAPEPGVGP